jgi:Domain of unknown function (DUF4333)
MARSIARAGARSKPSVTSRLRGFISLAIFTTYARYYRAVQARLARLCLGVLALAVLGACGVQPHHTISSSSAAAEISAQLASRYGISNPPVTCPANVPDKEGQAFVCTAVLDGQAVQMDATVTGSGGSFTIKPDSAIVVVSSLVSELTSKITTQTGHPATVSCGDRSLLVKAVGDDIACSATFPGEKPRAVRVTVVTLDGRFSFSLAGAGGSGGGQTLP